MPCRNGNSGKATIKIITVILYHGNEEKSMDYREKCKLFVNNSEVFALKRAI